MSYESDISTMPPGLDRAILRVLQDRVGIEKAITNQEIRNIVGQLGFHVKSERQVRLAVANLRKQKWLIGSGDSGFWMIANRKEWEEVKHRKLIPLIEDVSETIRIMDAEVRERFGDAWQETLV